MILSSTAVEYVRVPFAGKVAGVPINPTTGTVDLAFVAADLIGEPASGDWKAGTWETDTTQTPNLYYGRVLVGSTGTVQLVAGTYGVWIRVVLSPETIIRQSGQLIVI
jgi:hypothetical protein